MLLKGEPWNLELVRNLACPFQIAYMMDSHTIKILVEKFILMNYVD